MGMNLELAFSTLNLERAPEIWLQEAKVILKETREQLEPLATK